MSGSDGKAIIVKKGYLTVWKKTQFQTNYYALYRAAERNIARLEWYSSEEDFAHNSSEKRCLFLEQVENIDIKPYDTEMKKKYPADADVTARHVMTLKTKKVNKEYVIVFDAKKEMNDWHSKLMEVMKSIKKKADKVPDAAPIEKKDDDGYIPKLMPGLVYDVEIDDTTSAVRCNLRGKSFKLVLSQEHLTLVDSSGEVAVTWDYRLVRRFAFNEDTFNIEAGKRSGVGEGLFVFKKCPGREIMIKVNEIKERLADKINNEIYSEVQKFGNNNNISPSTSATCTPPATASPSIGSEKPKMSEILKALSKEPAKEKPDLDYGDLYSQLDIKSDPGRRQLDADTNLYGQQLIQHQTSVKSPYTGSDDYAELVEVPKAAPAGKKMPSTQTAGKPKMSEVLRALTMETAKNQSDLDNTYSQLNIKEEMLTRQIDHQTTENLYGQELIQKQTSTRKMDDGYTEVKPKPKPPASPSTTPAAVSTSSSSSPSANAGMGQPLKPKMSTILKAMSTQKSVEPADADLYNRLDIRMEADRRHGDTPPSGGENLYGQLLIKQQNSIKHNTDTDDYAEIKPVGKKK